MPNVHGKILVIDDDAGVLFGLQSLLKREGYSVYAAMNGEDGLQLAVKANPDLILCDVRMPGMNGFEFLQRLRWASETAGIPLIFLTALAERTDMLKGFSDGADDYVTKPFNPSELLARIAAILKRVAAARIQSEEASQAELARLFSLLSYGVLLANAAGVIRYANQAMQTMLGTEELAGHALFGFLPERWRAWAHKYLTGEIEMPDGFLSIERELLRADGTVFPCQISAMFISWHNEPVARMIVHDLSAAKDSAANAPRQDLLQAYEATLESWARGVDWRERDANGRSERVMLLTVALARMMGVPEEKIVHIRRGALLHDIGRLGIPDDVLLKAGPLNEQEWEIMRTHPTYAYNLLSGIEYLLPALEIPYAHHEKWDGTGYPRGLRGDAIPFAARMFAVVDVWDALTSPRPYRKAWEPEAAADYIRHCAGTHFDPLVVEVFLRMVSAKPVKN